MKQANTSHWIRRSHRVVSIVFTLTVIANFVAMALRPGTPPPPWITYSPLLPLALLLLSGLYLFAQPYIGRRKALTPTQPSSAARAAG